MRQFIYILAAVYVIVGGGTGLVYYAERSKAPAATDAGDRLAADAVVVGLLWPFHILDVLNRHDARTLS